MQVKLHKLHKNAIVKKLKLATLHHTHSSLKTEHISETHHCSNDKTNNTNMQKKLYSLRKICNTIQYIIRTVEVQYI